jgi:hypothetical protein
MIKKKRRNELKPDRSSAGQSGGDQALPHDATADSESVEELLGEGNSFEAGIVFGVEHSKDPSVSEVTTHEFPEDDIPREYINQD